MRRFILILFCIFILVFGVFFYKNLINILPEFAVLSINSRVFDDNLVLARKNLERNLIIIKKYLLNNGMNENQLSIESIEIKDNKNEKPIPMYFETVKTKGRFEAIGSVKIKSKNINLLRNLQNKMIYNYVNENKIEKELTDVNIFAYEREQDGDLLIYNRNLMIINKSF